MTQIIVTVEGDKEMARFLSGITENIEAFGDRLAWMAAQKCSKHIKNNAQFIHPRGFLHDSIHPEALGKSEYAVMATDYAYYVNEGRSAGKRPPVPAGGKIARWAGSQKAGFILARNIGAHGTRPTHFIDRGLMQARPDIEQSLRQHTDYYIKSGGKTL